RAATRLLSSYSVGAFLRCSQFVLFPASLEIPTVPLDDRLHRGNSGGLILVRRPAPGYQTTWLRFQTSLPPNEGKQNIDRVEPRFTGDEKRKLDSCQFVKEEQKLAPSSTGMRTGRGP
ncbi:Hypothetical protein SMAX5B_004771, partial [Scophthalmus maximus]